MPVKIPSANDIERRLPQARGRVYDIKPDRSGLFVAEAGRNIQAWGEKGQEEEDRLDIARAKSHYLAESIKAEQELDDDPDYTKWGERHSGRLAEAENAAMGMIRSGRQQEIFKAEIAPFSARAQAGVFDKQRKRLGEHQLADWMESAENTMALIVQAKDEKTRGGLINAWNDQGDALVKRGYISASAAVKAKQAFQNRYSSHLGDVDADNDPRRILGLTPGGAPGGNDAALISAESGGKSDVVNPFGFVGSYQFGAPRLQALGVYKPGAKEDMKGWDRAPQDAAGKWSGTFSIPGHPDVKTMEDFKNSPEAQKAAFAVHNLKMDEEIKSNGFDAYIGKTVQGVPITKDSLRNMLHLGGVGGAKTFLEGKGNPKDANGTSMLDYARMGASSTGGATMPEDRTSGIKQGSDARPVARPSYWQFLTPEQQHNLDVRARANIAAEEAKLRVEREAQAVQETVKTLLEAVGPDEERGAAIIRSRYTGVAQNQMIAGWRDRVNEINRVNRETKDDRFNQAANIIWEGGQVPSEMKAKLIEDGVWDKLGLEISAKASGVQRGSDYLWLHENYWSKSAEERAKVPLATIKQYAGRADYEKIVKERKEAVDVDPSEQSASELLSRRLRTLGLDPKKKDHAVKIDALHKEIETRYAEYEKKSGAKIPGQERRKIIEELTGKVAIDMHRSEISAGSISDIPAEIGAWIGGNSTIDVPLYELTVPGSKKAAIIAKQAGVHVDDIPAILRELSAEKKAITINNIRNVFNRGAQ